MLINNVLDLSAIPPEMVESQGSPLAATSFQSPARNARFRSCWRRKAGAARLRRDPAYSLAHH